MSRIHEALKRAEEDRAVAVAVRTENTEIETPPPGPVPLPPLQERAASDAASSVQPLTLEALLSRCTPRLWRPDTETMLFFNGGENGYGKEEFRTLRSRLYQMRERQPLKKLLIASSLPEEGRSFVAANLAQAMARQQGCRVLLIDSDLRRPGLHLMLGTPPIPGLSEYLKGEADELTVIQRGSMENLFFVAAGRTVSNPAELATNGNLKTFLNRVEPIFDWIILDSPPAVAVSDASLLAGECDGVLMVARTNLTQFDILRKAGQEFRGQQLIGVVLNGTREGSSPRYYASESGHSHNSGEVLR
jgi:protein-tyrosine kinase